MLATYGARKEQGRIGIEATLLLDCSVDLTLEPCKYFIYF